MTSKNPTISFRPSEWQKTEIDTRARQLLAGKLALSKEAFSEMEKMYLVLIITVVEIVNGAAYLFEKSAENN